MAFPVVLKPSCFIVFVLIFQLVKVHSLDNNGESYIFSKECGRRTVHEDVMLKIVQGSVAKKGSHPWIVNLFYNRKSRRFIPPKCGGAILNEKYILTAAHCCNLNEQNPIFIRVGEFNIAQTWKCEKYKNCSTNIQDIEVDSFKIHEKYVVDYYDGSAHQDICLIRLKDSIIFNQYVEPICLPNEDTIATGKEAEFAGWGKMANGETPGILQETKLTVLSSTECNNRLPEIIKHNSSSEICAVGKGHPCFGDSGGPLVYKGERNQFSVLGVASYSTENVIKVACMDDAPTVFADVKKFLPWIRDNMKP